MNLMIEIFGNYWHRARVFSHFLAGNFFGGGGNGGWFKMGYVKNGSHIAGASYVKNKRSRFYLFTKICQHKNL